MANVRYFPTSDSKLLTWLQNFASTLSANASAYGATTAQCTAVTAYVNTFATAMAACEPTIRSRASTTAKNTARDIVKAQVRLLVNLVNSQATVTEAMKEELGLPARASPRPSQQPEAPVLEVKSVNGYYVNIRLRGSSGSSRGKPKGVAAATIFSFVGSQPSTDMAAWKFEGNTTLTENTILFPNTLPAGTQVFLTAMFLNGRMVSGPACSPVGIRLQGGSVSMAA